jgi:plasmid maintenance system killer protein
MGDFAGLPAADTVDRLFRNIQMIDDAATGADLLAAGNRFDKLKGANRATRDAKEASAAQGADDGS